MECVVDDLDIVSEYSTGVSCVIMFMSLPIAASRCFDLFMCLEDSQGYANGTRPASHHSNCMDHTA